MAQIALARSAALSSTTFICNPATVSSAEEFVLRNSKNSWIAISWETLAQEFPQQVSDRRRGDYPLDRLHSSRKSRLEGSRHINRRGELGMRGDNDD